MPARPKKGHRFGGSPKHQRLMMANLVSSLVASPTGIVTTEAKAKAVRPIAEKLITKAKKGGLHNHRQILAYVGDQEIAAILMDALNRLFGEYADRFKERPGGYTRILKLGPRSGDKAPMAKLELV
jgi:large subunit ribosomal protein L17